MAIEVGEAILFIVIGLVVGIAIILVLMQSRMSRKAEQLRDRTRQEMEMQFEQRKQETESQYRNLYSTEFEKWKTEHELQHQEEVEGKIKAEVTKALNGSRNTIKGRINEQLASLFPEFTSKYVAADARFLGTPVDFVIFKNLSTLSSNEPQLLEVVFVEVKTGKSNLTPAEKAVKSAVDNLRVKFETLKISTGDNGADLTQTQQLEPARSDGVTQ